MQSTTKTMTMPPYATKVHVPEFIISLVKAEIEKLSANLKRDNELRSQLIQSLGNMEAMGNEN
jgi:hypothetical protein